MKFMSKYVIVTLKILFFRNVNMDYNSIFRIQIIDETCLLFIYIYRIVKYQAYDYKQK